MLVKALKLGVTCADRVTGMQGMLTHWQYEADGRIRYLFQPTMLSPDTGLPVDKLAMPAEQVVMPTPDCWEETETPAELLGQKVRDKASGFKGTATALVRHINGCFHAILLSSELVKGKPPRYDLDLRQLDGDSLPARPADELQRSRQEKPSPTGDAVFEEPCIV